ncbi:MAG TPA: PilN domain-containing protein [Burkholderiaceae bacterium]|nr:PilN domain-containing protein [Burkholderiaceae bacterium]
MAQNVNLLEPTSTGPSPGRVGLRRAAIAAVLVSVATVTVAALQVRGLGNARAELARVQAETQRLQREQIDAATPDPALIAQIMQDQRDVEALELIAHQLTNGSFGRTQGFADELRAFGRATASGIWLTGLKLDNPTNSMTLDGKAIDASRVPALIHALESEPHFSGTRFASIELHASETQANSAPRTVDFRIATPVSDLVVDVGKDPVQGAAGGTAPAMTAR